MNTKLENMLRLTVESDATLIEAVRAIKKIAQLNKKKGAEPVVFSFHQDAFAGDYREDEFLRLRRLIKYAGLFGVQVIVVGTNQETLSASRAESLQRQDSATKEQHTKSNRVVEKTVEEGNEPRPCTLP